MYLPLQHSLNISLSLTRQMVCGPDLWQVLHEDQKYTDITQAIIKEQLEKVLACDPWYIIGRRQFVLSILLSEISAP